jgi:protein-L-isoaspartate(D-aspartate) O-methyltransferase
VLIEQLRSGGQLVIPVGSEGGHQRLEVIDKAADGKLHRRIVTCAASGAAHQL